MATDIPTAPISPSSSSPSKYRYPLTSPTNLSREAREAAAALLLSDEPLTMGKHVEAFERKVEALYGVKHAVMVNSGSSANLLAVEAMLRPSNNAPRWKAGDEILVPALSWSTTVAPIVQLGLTPVFVDCELATLGMDIEDLESKITARTRGVMLVSVLGQTPGYLDAIRDLCRRRGLTLVYDCCEAFGHIHAKAGLITTFSLFFSHQMTTSEGGILITDDDAIADDLRSMRAHGWSRNRGDKAYWDARANPQFNFVTMGYNVRPTEVQGVMGCVEIDQWAQKRQSRLRASERLGAIVNAWSVFSGPGPWMNVPMYFDDAIRRPDMEAVFDANGVEWRPIIAGNLSRHPAFARLGYEAPCRRADLVWVRGLMIGCHEGDIGAVEEAIASL